MHIIHSLLAFRRDTPVKDPTTRIHSSDEPERVRPPRSNGEWHGWGTMLVADNDPFARDPVAALLEHAGFNIITARGCQDAVSVFREEAESIVAVLLDQRLTGGKVDDVFEELRRLRPNIPVIIMSGYMTDDVVDHFESMGVVGFLQKPFGRETLLEKVRAALGSSAA